MIPSVGHLDRFGCDDGTSIHAREDELVEISPEKAEEAGCAAFSDMFNANIFERT